MIKNCEENEESGRDSGSFQERMWFNQLTQKEIILNGEIKEDIIEKAVIHIFNFNKMDDENEKQIANYERQPITVYINSPGGLLDEAFSLIAAIESSKTPVITIGLGKAMSSGFLILLAGHYRVVQKYTSLMYHQGSVGYMGEFGKHFEVAEYWKECQSKVEKYIVKNTKIKKSKLEQVFKNKTDWYINPKEAKELGIVDEII
jgi:ATP-dependent Clp protease, protease subunit